MLLELFPPVKRHFSLHLWQVWWAASDLGWVVGHSYICYGPLLHGNSTILYEVRPRRRGKACSHLDTESEIKLD